MLSVKTRQIYLKKLGFYKGEITGVEDKATKQAYKKLQKKYFVREQDIDGIYGKNTDILLVNAARVDKRTKNFKLEEFKCNCGGRFCTGYPVKISIPLLENVQSVRDKYKQPITVTSCLRCNDYNAELNGSIERSLHEEGDAIDYFVAKVTVTETGRLKVMKYWLTLDDANFAYAFLPKKGRTKLEKTCKNMGNAVHCDVK